MGILADFMADEDAATAVEYGLMAALIAVSAILAFTAFGNSLGGLFGSVDSRTGSVMSDANAKL